MAIIWKTHPSAATAPGSVRHQKHSRYLKSITDGRIYIWTAILAKREDMGECDKVGKWLRKTDARRDVSDLTFIERVLDTRKEEQMVDIAAAYDMAFAEGMTVQQMQVGLLRELARMQDSGELPAGLSKEDFSEYAEAAAEEEDEAPSPEE